MNITKIKLLNISQKQKKEKKGVIILINWNKDKGYEKKISEEKLSMKEKKGKWRIEWEM